MHIVVSLEIPLANTKVARGTKEAQGAQETGVTRGAETGAVGVAAKMVEVIFWTELPTDRKVGKTAKP